MALRNLILSNIKKISYYNLNSVNTIFSNGIFSFVKRQFNTSKINYIKEIQEVKEGNLLILEGVIKPSERVPTLLKHTQEHSGDCPVCALKLDIKHTDVLILSQFLRSDGCMLPRRITGLCRMQQKRMGILVTMAQKAGLMPNINPSYSNKDPTLRSKWKKYNTYFLEETIGKRPKLRAKQIPKFLQKSVL